MFYILLQSMGKRGLMLKSFIRKSGKFIVFEPKYILQNSVTFYYTTGLVKDTALSIHGRSHTSANLDLEINEESKNEDIVRNRYHSLYLYKLTFCGRVILETIQKVPGRSQNNRASASSIWRNFGVADTFTHLILIESRQSYNRNCTSNHFTFSSSSTEKAINPANKVEQKSLRS